MGLGNFGGFSYYDGDLNYVNNDQFGTCTIESLDPLTVTYAINEGVTWSDGTPIDAADLLLQWAAREHGVQRLRPRSSRRRHDGRTPTPRATRSSSMPMAHPCRSPPELFDPETEELLPGYTYQEAAGVNFDAASESLQLVTQLPEISEDGQAVTATWDSFYVDYQLDGVFVGVPAHVVAEKALGIDDPAAGKQAIIDAITTASESGDATGLKEISEFWNTGFDFTSLPDDPDLYLSAGPYLLTAYEEVSQMTFEVNPDYTWGPKPKAGDDRLPHHRRPDGGGAGDAERGDRPHPAAGDGRHPDPARGARRSRRRGRHR